MVPVMVIESRSSAGETAAIAVLSRESTNVVVDARSPEVCLDLSWAGYPYDGSYSSTTDSDGDGISDYEEIFWTNTDPWLADSDGDGISDGEEDVGGTDPRDVRSHDYRLSVSVTNTIFYSDTTNYVFFGDVASWKSNLLCSCTGYGIVTNWIVQTAMADVAGAFVDFDRDGEFDATKDVLQTVDVRSWQTQIALRFVFGDMDGDGVEDKIELDHGSDYSDRRDFCLSVGMNDMSGWPTNRPVWLSVDGEVFDLTTNSIVHCHVTNGVLPQLVASNGEYGVRLQYKVSGPAVEIASLDSDRDEMPDLWELAAGLCPTNGADAIADNDHDGLINLHEYWAGTEPLTADGSNTLLSVCARSVDDRLVGINLTNDVCRFVDYFRNASNEIFVVNTNLWCRDVDLSCVSMWHQEEDRYETRGTRMATAITRRHVLVSSHWHSNQYRFCDTNGSVVVRGYDRSECVYRDTFLARLTEPLPMSVVPAKLLPDDYEEYIRGGKYLPSVCVNEKQQVVVGELEDLNASVNGFQHYGKVSSTNIVTEAREGIRAAISIGQSSSPVFLMVGDTPALLLIKHLGYPDALQWNPTWGPSLSHFIDKIQRTIDSWEGEGACRLDVVDLTVFEKVRSK